MNKLLILRFSALGDVAMTIPVIDSLARQYPELEITMVSKPFVAPLFKYLPKNVVFMGVDLNKDYHGLLGLHRLYKRLSVMGFDAVADFHDVLRTKYIRNRFLLSRVPVSCIDKGRDEKRKMVSRMPKDYQPLKSSFERYRQVLERLGLPLTIRFHSLFGAQSVDSSLLPQWLTDDLQIGAKPIDDDSASPLLRIGIAPFAAHAGKIYPFEQMDKVISQLQEQSHIRICLFGGKSHEEKEAFERWVNLYPGVVSVAGRLKLDEELVLMSLLDGMVSMDSANMHLASLVGVPVVSVWGATHPCLGFMGWNQDYRNAVQIDLACRPCSVYGKKPCKRGDYACLQQIEPNMIVEKVLALKKK